VEHISGAGKRFKRIALAAAAALATPACGTAQTAEPGPARQPEIARIWPAAPPGTEGWTGPEVEADAELPGAGKVHIVTNVTVPTVTIFRPQAGKANGTAMVVAPGGAFRALAWDMEGTEVAQWLSSRGIAAFVLKYRVRPPTGESAGKLETFDEWALKTKDAREVAVADGQQALRFIRANARKYGVAPNRVGMIGFSAGAMTTMGAALTDDAAARPDFAVPVYGAMITSQAPKSDSPPLFIVAAQDDPQVPSAKSVEIYERWSRAQRPAELHLFEKGGHGFGMRKRALPADKWPAALEAWLLSRGFLTATPQ
jgi:acetyl esterase/lipase